MLIPIDVRNRINICGLEINPHNLEVNDDTVVIELIDVEYIAPYRDEMDRLFEPWAYDNQIMSRSFNRLRMKIVDPGYYHLQMIEDKLVVTNVLTGERFQ
jgi:hypothetical protein